MRPRLLAGGALCALAIAAGLVLVATGYPGERALVAVGAVLFGAGAVGLVSLVFWGIGRSEDRHRDRHPSG